MIKLEIEILSANAKDYQYELRNFLNDRLENMQVAIKEKPAGEGQMSLFTAEGILDGVIHAGMGISIEQAVLVFLPLMKDFFKHIHIPFGKKVEILATMGDGSERVTLSEDNEGVSKRYDNVSYSIDTEHMRAVLIGNCAFDNDFSPIPPVKNNLEDLCKLLSDKRNIGLPIENISIALDKTNTEIEELLLRVSKLPDTETLLIYFTGHGYRSDVNKLFLIARNTRKIDDYISGGVDYDFIKNVVLKSSPARQKILILDTCHSGIAAQGAEDAVPELNVTGTYILASSESDESSYFDKNKRNTFFTTSLLDTLSNGMDNDREMLALNDLYENARNHLDQRQQPLFKNKLNISPADFFIARNPAFSFEKSIQHARDLFKAGNLFEALNECRKILKRQPNNAEVKNLATQCNSDLLLAQLIKQGDEYFYQRHQYGKSLENYQQAHEINPGFMTAEKIRNCQAALGENKLTGTSEIKLPTAPADVDSPPKKENKLNEAAHNDAEEKGWPAKLMVLGIALLVAFSAWWLLSHFQGHEEKTDFTMLTALLDSLPAQAMEQLREAQEKDSAYYIIGNYYRTDKKPDSAVYFYDKSIAFSNLPAAYSALAGIYYNGEIQDSIKWRSPYDILKKADSLFKADTIAYYMLGSILDQNAQINTTGYMRSYWLYEKKLSAGSTDQLIEDASRFYLKGFKKGSVQCATGLGFLYLNIRKDPVSAYPFLKKSAENNVPIAQFFVSDMLAQGYGVKKNTAESNQWLQSYINHADVAELLHAASLYANKEPAYLNEYMVEPDCAKAAILYNAADSNAYTIHEDHERADLYLALGNFYYGKNADCKQILNLSKARGYYQKASDLGNVSARSYLEEKKWKK